MEKRTPSKKQRAQNASKSCSRRCRKTYRNPLFRCSFLFLAHISAARNFSTLTLLGRNFVVKWPIWWPIRGVIRVNCHIL